MRKAVSTIGRAAGRMGKSLMRLGRNLALGLSAAVAGLGVLAVKTAADIESMTVAFESLLGSGEQATAMMEKLIKFTARTPFQLEGVGKAAKQLLGFGVEAESIEETLKFLGDIAAGANVPLSDMAAIFGKVKAKGKAMTEELLQLSDRGVPIIDTLAKGFNTTGENVFKMASQGKISFEIMQQALESLTKEGGVFEDQMAKQSRTVAGIFSTLKDNIMLALATVGNFMVKVLDLRNNMNKLIVSIQKGTEVFKVWATENQAEIQAFFSGMISGIVETSKVIFQWVRDNKKDIMDFISGVVALAKAFIWLGRIIAKAFNIQGKIIGNVLGFIVTEFLKMINGAVRDIEWFVGRIKELFSTVTGIINPIIDKATAFAGTVRSFFGGREPTTQTANVVGSEKSQTEVRIKVGTDKDSTATVERVKNVQGDAKVNVASETMLGVLM